MCKITCRLSFHNERHILLYSGGCRTLAQELQSIRSADQTLSEYLQMGQGCFFLFSCVCL